MLGIFEIKEASDEIFEGVFAHPFAKMKQNGRERISSASVIKNENVHLAKTGALFLDSLFCLIQVTENKPLTVKGKCEVPMTKTTCPLPVVKKVSGFYCDGFEDEILQSEDHIPDGSTCRMICETSRSNSPLAEYTNGGGTWKGKPASCK